MEALTFSNKDLNFKLPFGMIVSGPSSSGKSTFLLKFISEASDLIDPKPRSILYCFGEMSGIVPILQKSGVDVFVGVPPEELIKTLARVSLTNTIKNKFFSCNKMRQVQKTL